MSDNALSNSCVSFDLQNVIKSATCFKSTKGSSIDECLVSQHMRFKKILNLECWLSDFHNFICITTKLTVSKKSPEIIQYRSLKNFKNIFFNYDLYELSAFMDSQGKINVCNATQKFCVMLHDIINHHAPLKTKTIYQQNVPYMNSQWRKLRHQRNMLRNLKNKYPTSENVNRYRKLRNECVKLQKSSRRKYFSEHCDGGTKKINISGQP